jgi:predicted amidohydrolase YtcJ
MRRVDLADTDDPGVERDTDGHPTGRVWRAGRALRRRWAVPRRPDLARLSARLFALGITGVTDATPDQDRETVRLLRAEVRQDLLLLGDPDATGPWKIVVADHDLPSLAELVDRIAARRPRPVAVHCVSRVALVLTVEALTITGGVVGDRIEHAAVCPPEAAGRLARLGTTVVTQPSLPASRGDDYLDRVEPDEVAQLWPFASLVAAGVGVGCSSDAPYGDLDPWHSIAAAAERRTPSGRLVAPHERVNRRRALTGFLTGATAPGGSERPVLVGACADLVLLDRPLGDALRHPSAEHVRLTVRAGEVVHERGDIEDGAS